MARSPEVHVHVHISVDQTGDSATILANITELKAMMTDLNTAMDNLSAAQSAMAARIDEDVAHLQDLLSQQSILLDAAMANDASDAAAIADLTAQRDALAADGVATVARINETTAQLAAIDPLADFPVAPEA